MSFISFVNNTINLTSVSSSEILEGLTFQFVLQNGSMTKDMKTAYEAAKEKFAEKSLSVLTVEECVEISKANLKEGKKIFIFDEFDQKNSAFNYIYNASTVYILGTRCLQTILFENIPTPGGMFHIHNLAMRSLIICATSLSKEKKKEIKQLVNFMGANYSDALNYAVTHLVSESVRSIKYEKATEKDIKVMHPDWVTSVWQKTQNTNVNILATEEQFDRYKLPAFFSLCFTSTGLKTQERENIKKLVEENGGRYNLSFSSVIDILIMSEAAIGCEKHKAAVKLKKICLKPEWIFVSAEKGFAIPFGNYQHNASSMKSSTPTKITNCTLNLPDMSTISNISRGTTMMNDMSINETAATIARQSLVPVLTTLQKDMLSGITLQAARKVGNLLDGFNFYLSGFTTEQVMLLGKILSLMGGTKMNSINDQVTHVLVGESDSKLFDDLDEHHVEPAILKIDWLRLVVQERRLVDEVQFEIQRAVKKKQIAQKPSPASKKAMKSLSENFKKPDIPKFSLDARKKQQDQEEIELVNQFLEPPNPSEQSEDDFSQCEQFLAGKNVFIYGFHDSFQSAPIIDHCEKHGATLVDETFKKEVDYVITTNELIKELKPPVKYKKIVTDLWLEDSTVAGKCIDVLFYHKPIVELEQKAKFLQNESFVATNYKGEGRNFIERLVYNLGGTYSEVMKRSDHPIIFSPTPEGKKFESAKAWEMTVLKVEWLLECLEKKRRVDETPYLVGGTKVSERNQKSRGSIVPSSQEVDSIDQFDVLDPPIENFVEEVLPGPSNDTPIRAIPSRLRNVEQSPQSPLLNQSISRLVQDMPTPQRNITKEALLEAKLQNVESPRLKRLKTLMNTPATKARNLVEDINSPKPELPELMKPPSGNFGIVPDSSPGAQWFHKRKIEALDENYIPRAEKKTKPNDNEPTPPYSHRRYDFFKARIPDYDSPDPRGVATQCLIDASNKSKSQSCEASKFLNFGDDDDEDNVTDQPLKRSLTAPTSKNGENFDEFKQLQMEKQNDAVERPATTSGITKEFAIEELENKPEKTPQIESEMLVVWEEDNHSRCNSRSSIEEVDEKTRRTPSKFVFALNGIDEIARERTIDNIKKLGGKHDSLNFTHLITPKPNRSEKFLISLAKGGYVVLPEYIEKCLEKNYFIDEAEYEMGNPKMLPELEDKLKTDSLWKSPYNWRQWIHFDHKDRFKEGAFTGFNFVLLVSSEKSPQFKNILESGGAKEVIVDFKSPLDAAILKRTKVNLCLAEKTKMVSNEISKMLRTCGIKSVNVSYISDHLTSGAVPEPI